MDYSLQLLTESLEREEEKEFLIIFDTETTGLNEEDRIIQIGIDFNNEFSLSEFCLTDVDIKVDAMAISGITPEVLSENATNYFCRYKKLRNI